VTSARDRQRSEAAQPKARRRGWAFIDLAASGVNSARSYALAGLAIVVLPSLAAMFLAVYTGIGPASALVQQYVPIALAGAVAIWAVMRLHRRPWHSLIAANARLDWRRLAIGAAAQFAIMGGQLLLLDAMTGWRLNLTLPISAAVAILAVCLIPLQAASEELLFRGYLTQALGRMIRSRIAIAGLVALVFGILHFNTHGGLTLPYFFVLSLVFSLVSLRDEGIELAIGGHAAMNLFAFGAANSSIVAMGAIGAPPASMIRFNATAILILLIDGLLFYGLTRLGVRLLCVPR
jgi:membrane protease YdiL (CAAX protease family)